MICPNCKKEISDRVYPHHVARCSITEPKPAKKTEKKPVKKTAKK